ncbi:MAG: hypothetical protein ABMB14_28750 [Myxococcota bacterium]
MPEARKVRDAADAVACLVAADRAGLAPRDWAHRNGVNARSLHMWRILLDRQRGQRSAPLRLVELVPAVVAPRPPVYRVCCGELSIELDDRFDEAVVLRLLRVVRQC